MYGVTQDDSSRIGGGGGGRKNFLPRREPVAINLFQHSALHKESHEHLIPVVDVL
jgi:hypothetical protein